MQAPALCYTGPFLDASGYGEATRNFISAFAEAGANIKTQRVTFTGNVNYLTRGAKLAEELSTREVPYNIKILHVTPDVYRQYMEPGKYHIGHLFWETDKLPLSWVAGCNLMDEIWTGTQLNKDTIVNSGVKVPVYVFPEAVDVDIPAVRPFKLPNFEGFVFYSIFEWNERKNPKTLLSAYWREFKGIYDVALLLKVHKGSYSTESVGEIISEAKRWKNEMGFKDTPRVFLCTNILSEEEKHRFHATGDVYVSSHRGEGWSIPIAEASLHRKPVVSVNFGGITEYFMAKHFYEVESELVSIDRVYNKYYEPGMHWAQASEKSLRLRMRTLYDYNKTENKKTISKIKAGAAHTLVTTFFNFKSVGEKMMARLREIETIK